MTIWRDLRAVSMRRLAEAGVDDPGQEFRWIAERASGRSVAEQVSALDEIVTDRELSHVEQMLQRRSAGEPLQYVLGRWGFRTLDLLVDQRVLIPRSETEVVAGLAIDAIAQRDAPRVAVDLGTGSGAIALAIAAELWPDVEVWASDASAPALAVARANLAALGRRSACVRLVQGHWFSALPHRLLGRVDVMVANPPYVATTEALPSSVADWEPTSALLAGPDGLTDLREIISGAGDWLVADGTLVLEIGDMQAEAVAALAHAAGFSRVSIERDLAGRDRALVAHRS